MNLWPAAMILNLISTSVCHPSVPGEHSLYPSFLPTLISLWIYCRGHRLKNLWARHSMMPHFLRVTKCWLLLWLKIIMRSQSLKGRKCHNFTFLFENPWALASRGWFPGKATSDWRWVISSTFWLPKPLLCPLDTEAVVQWLSISLIPQAHFLEFFMALLTHLAYQSIPRDLTANAEIYENNTI